MSFGPRMSVGSRDLPQKRLRRDLQSWDMVPRDTFNGAQSVHVDIQDDTITFDGSLEAFECVLVSHLQRRDTDARIRRRYTLEQAASELRQSFSNGTGGWTLHSCRRPHIYRKNMHGDYDITLKFSANEFWFIRPSVMEDGITTQDILCIMAREPGSDAPLPEWFDAPFDRMLQEIKGYHVRLMREYYMKRQPWVHKWD